MIPLVVRSSFSFLRGSSPAEELVARAVELRLPALALTDEATLAGSVAFWTAARTAGLTPLLGARVGDLTLLARNRNGWGNLCAILSRHHLGADPELERHQQDLHVVARDPERALALRGIVDRLWIEVVRPAPSATAERAALLSGLPPVASTDVHFARPSGFRAHRVLAAVAGATTLDRLGPTCLQEHHLRDLRALFADLPEALAHNEAIATDCAWEFLPAPVVFPEFPLPPGETAEARLRALAEAGLRRRYGEPSEEARGRLDRELAVIGRLGFAGYFLVVHEIVQAARRMDTPVAGRGSGASSLVAYALGLTNVCPLARGIQFERFLHDGRRDWPDLDLDFCWRTRDGVIDYAFERFGRGRVAMVSSHLTFQGRGAFREAARAHGLSDDQIREVRRGLPPDAEDRLDARGARRLPVEASRLAEILADARAILDAPWRMSVHPGGIVISPGPLDRIVPLQRAEKGVVISQLDKDGVEAAGLVKIDLLGNRAVSTIRATTELVAALDGHRLDVERIPDDDPATLDLLAGARLIGVNQVESPAMRHLLRQMRPRGLDDVMQALALIRPGAAGEGMKEAFLRRRRGEEPARVDPRLEGVLGATHGVLLYEDDLMLVHHALTGAPLAEGDRFRRSVQKARSPEELAAAGRAFGAACRAAGAPLELARGLWRQMAKFTGYVFCMGHAASYARLAWAAAWMKAHHPVAFWVAALNNNQGMYEKRVYLAEAARGGIPALGPCVNASGREFAPDGGAIRIGLDEIDGLSAASIGAILEGRPFASLQDLLRRVRLDRPEAEALVKCGALDFAGRPRAELMLELAATWKRARSARDAGTLDIPRIPDVPERTKRLWECAILGCSPEEHLLRILHPGLDRERRNLATDLPELAGRRARLFGVLDALRIADTKRGDAMEFLTFEDESGVFEATAWPDAYRRLARDVRGVGPYRIEGRVEDHRGAVTLVAERIEEARAGPQSPVTGPRSAIAESTPRSPAGPRAGSPGTA